MNNPNESFPQKPVNAEQEKINGAINMISHHIGTFLLTSRMGKVYNQTELAKSIGYVDELRLVLHTPEQLKKLDEFVEKVNSILDLDAASPKDNNVMNELGQLMGANIKSLKVSD
jgi:hypothetical protein